jgi:hypothetical protein
MGRFRLESIVLLLLMMSGRILIEKEYLSRGSFSRGSFSRGGFSRGSLGGGSLSSLFGFQAR